MSKLPSSRKFLLISGLLFYVFFLFGMAFPDTWWGTHFVYFLPTVWKVVCMAAALGLILLGLSKNEHPGWLNRLGEWGGKVWMPVVLAILAGLAFYALPIHHDIYGDAEAFARSLSGPSNLSTEAHRDLFLDPNVFQSKIGERTVLNGVWLFGNSLGLDYKEAFRWIDAICGFLFVLTGLFFLRHYIEEKRWRIVLMVVLMSTPVFQNFCGHVEIYAPAILFFGGFMMCLLLYFKTSKTVYLLLQLPALFFAMKVHSSAVLFIPALLMSLVHSAGKQNALVQRLFTWKGVALIILLPAFLLGSYVYFFVLQDHIDPRSLADDLPVLERLFLPMFSPEAPLDRYNLFSLNHILDYFNMMLMWSAGACFLLVAFLGAKRKEINWNSPTVVVSGITFLFFFGFFFMVNPLLGMVVDWDLFTLPGVVFLFFVFAVTRETRVAPTVGVFGTVVALGLLGLLSLPVNHNQQMLSYRTEHLAAHSFKTYWIHSADFLRSSLDMLPDDKALHAQRTAAIAQRLEPYANEGNDIIYAHIARIAAMDQRELQQMELSKAWYEKVRDYHPKDSSFPIDLMEAYFVLEDYENAYLVSEQLIRDGIPSVATAQSIALQCAVYGGKYEQALLHSRSYLALVPDDQFVLNVYQLLQQDGHTQRALQLYSQ